MLLGDNNTLYENHTGEDTDRYLEKRYATNKNVIYISAEKALCVNAKCPLTAAQGIPITFDPDHFTREGAQLAVRQMFTAEIKKAIFDHLASRIETRK